jgi:hypothetical protein
MTRAGPKSIFTSSIQMPVFDITEGYLRVACAIVGTRGWIVGVSSFKTLESRTRNHTMLETSAITPMVESRKSGDYECNREHGYAECRTFVEILACTAQSHGTLLTLPLMIDRLPLAQYFIPRTCVLFTIISLDDRHTAPVTVLG